MPNWLATILGRGRKTVSQHRGRTWFPDEDQQELQDAQHQQRIARASANAAADSVRENMTYLEKALSPIRGPYYRSRDGHENEEAVQS